MNLASKLIAKVDKKKKEFGLGLGFLAAAVAPSFGQNINDLEKYQNSKDIPSKIDTNFVKRFTGWDTYILGEDGKSKKVEKSFVNETPEKEEEKEPVYKDTARISHIDLMKDKKEGKRFYLPKEIEFSVYDFEGRVSKQYTCSRKEIDSNDLKKRIDSNSFRGFDSVTVKEFLYDEFGNVKEEKISFLDIDSSKYILDAFLEGYLDKVKYNSQKRILYFFDSKGNVLEKIMGEDFNGDDFVDEIKIVDKKYNQGGEVIEEFIRYDFTPFDGRIDSAKVTFYE